MKTALSVGSLAFIIGLALSPAAWSQATPPAPQESNGIPYLSGGVGDGERQQLEAVSKDYNLKLILAERSGSYIAQVDVNIVDAKGSTVLEAQSVGPFFLAKLPPGNYRVTATYGGKVLRQRIAVPSRGLQTREFYW
ncbi:MAG: carboxypeptidase-like regulatory domain-containing protein [Betaproteobacteria bacterium]